jgi:hypothetical protein
VPIELNRISDINIVIPNHTFVNKSINERANSVGITRNHHNELIESVFQNSTTKLKSGRSQNKLPGRLKSICEGFFIY